MKPEEYIEQRLEDQIKWYDQKSISSQTTFKRLRHIEIILAASIPLITTLTSQFPCLGRYGLIVLGLLGITISILAGFIAFGQYQEHWIEYRTTCESLKKEKYLFLTNVEPFCGENSFELLVQRVESLISKENTNWSQYMMNHENGEKDVN